ncbi:hypothetical protein XFLM_03310 [Xylella fastidiosa subsp. fastidiosa GB514]|nr:hypothetical protein XFLM_03310 [Xylella fastidiosa subsp. fastidiosa GB514]
MVGPGGLVDGEAPQVDEEESAEGADQPEWECQ